MNEPSVVAIQRNPLKVKAVGNEAKRMLGRAPGSIEVIRPMRDGQIADFEVTNTMLAYFMNKVHKEHNRSVLRARPRVLVCVPSQSTEIEKRTIRESAQKAGAREVHLIEEPLAAAVGAGLNIEVPAGNLIVDIGGGTTDIAIISLNGIVVSDSIRVGGDEFDRSIMNYIRGKESCVIGEVTAESVKKQLGTAQELPDSEVKELDVKAHNLATGIPKKFTLTSLDIYQALQDPLSKIVSAVKQTMSNCPPEISADIAESGIVLTGGGALIDGLDMLLTAETGLPVVIAEDPLTCVARGCGTVLSENRVGLFI